MDWPAPLEHNIYPPAPLGHTAAEAQVAACSIVSYVAMAACSVVAYVAYVACSLLYGCSSKHVVECFLLPPGSALLP